MAATLPIDMLAVKVQELHRGVRRHVEAPDARAHTSKLAALMLGWHFLSDLALRRGLQCIYPLTSV